MKIILVIEEENGDVIRRVEVECFGDDPAQAAQTIVDLAEGYHRSVKELAP